MDSQAANDAALRAERLKLLQMEDLGSARREHISTSDIKRTRIVSIQSLEAARMSNVRGTDAQRTAEANKEKLSGWANVYKDIGDTDDLEHLDTLLDGQTHRFQLNAAIRGSGGQSYTQEPSKGKLSSKTGPKGSVHAGSGPGTEVSKHHQRPGTSANTTSARGMTRTASMRQPTLARKPSVNFSRGPTADHHRTREGYDQKHSTNKGFGKRPPPASLRTRRPAPDFVGEVSSPESFLAAARSVYDPKSLQRTPITSGSASNDNSGDNPPADAIQPPKKKLHTSLVESVYCPSDDKQARPELSSKLVEKSVLTGASTSLDHSIHNSHNNKPASIQNEATTSLNDSIHNARDNNITHPKPASDLRTENFAKEMKAHLNRSIHSPKNDGTSREPSKTPVRHIQSESITSPGRAMNIKEEATHPKASPQSAAKPHSKQLPTSLERSIHSFKNDSSSGSIELSKTPAGKSQNESTISLHHAGSNINKTSHPGALPDSAAKPRPKEPSASLNLSIHSPKNDNSSGSAEPLKAPARYSPGQSATSTSLDCSAHRPQTDKSLSLQTPKPVTKSESTVSLQSQKIKTSVVTPQPKATKAQKSTQEHGVLLDFNTTPTKSSTQKETNNDPVMSPAFEDLKGLDFAGPSPSPVVQTLKQEQSQPFPKKRIDFRAVATEVHESKSVTKDDPSTLSENVAESDFQTDIDMLCKLLGSTSLSEKQKESLQECKDELQSKISNHPQTPKPKKSKLDNTSASNTPTGNRSSAFSPQSRLNVATPAFVPRTSFENHRSPTRSFSSDSTQYTEPVEKKQPAVVKHIIGNHLLPGRRGRPDEPMNNTAFPGYNSPPAFSPTSEMDATQPLPDSIIFRPRPQPRPVQITDPSGSPLKWSDHAPSSPSLSSSQENSSPHSSQPSKRVSSVQYSIHAARGI